MDLKNSEPTTVCHVVALPSPGRGHINPMMNLCKSLSSKKPDLLITFIVTEEWLGFIGSDPKPDNIRFSTVPNVIPSEGGRGADSPGFYEDVLRKMRAPVEELLDRLEPLPITIMIADTYMNWAIDIGNQRNVPVASLWTMSASVYSVFHHFDLLVQHHHFPVDFAAIGDEHVDYIPGVSSTRMADLPTCLYGKGLKVLHRALEAVSWVPKAQCLLLPSVYELEAQVIDALKENVAVPIYHIGPTRPYFKLEENSSAKSSGDANYLEWLDLQPRGSVLYVSQGSLHSVSNSQMEEIAGGLSDSGVRFFWVTRGETSRINELCGEMGLLVPWCDQLRVLCHPSIGGFWSHCGWNSTSEAVFAGLPMLTFPIYWDQVTNSKVVVDDWKIGWRVKKEVESDNLVGREEIERLVKGFMDLESDEGKEVRRKARELQKICRQAIQKGGSTDASIDAFVSEISYCHKH
ncbi:UDP-glycosyltransferase 87A2-like [Corylus avellana]|uniref:UDP-glycosyltransferase 87A2-like n=1 Tax=Corylus avellana TaxID=13451 RepID=UPI00286D0043|nr:UDP-glycosyltransferase 87A2-like [Corylus avellana]